LSDTQSEITLVDEKDEKSVVDWVKVFSPRRKAESGIVGLSRKIP